MDELRATRRGLVKALAGLPAIAAVLPNRLPANAGTLLARDELLLEPGLIHLNTASAGPTTKRVLARTMAAWRQLETDPVAQSYYDDPGTVFSAADAVRGKAAALIGATPDNILVTRGTTDGITTLAHSIRLKEGDRVLLSNLEHEGGEVGWLHRSRLDGVVIDRVNLPFTEHDPSRIVDAYAAAISPRTRVISVSHVLAPTGLKMPIREIAALARAHRILCVVDGAQAAGHVPVDVKALGCHAYATSGHKWLMGPKGIGFVFIASDAEESFELAQWQLGRQVGSNSAGLGPLTLAVGLGQAIDDLRGIGADRVTSHNFALAGRVHRALSEMPGLQVVSAPPGPGATAMVAAILPRSIDAEQLHHRMRQRHRVVIKLAEKRWFNGIRLSPHLFNSEAEVDIALAALRSEIGNWRS